jgi:hypothetical protein
MCHAYLRFANTTAVAKGRIESQGRRAGLFASVQFLTGIRLRNEGSDAREARALFRRPMSR